MFFLLSASEGFIWNDTAEDGKINGMKCHVKKRHLERKKEHANPGVHKNERNIHSSN